MSSACIAAHRLAAVLVGLGCACACACDADRREPPAGWAPEIARVESRLGLRWPYEVRRIGRYIDGGSIGGAVGDARGQEVEFCWDGRMRVSPEHAARFGTRGAAIDTGPRLAYLGADYPKKPGARPLHVGSPEESALVAVLRLAGTRSFRLTVQDSLVAIRNDLTPASAWHAMWPRLYESERNDLEALRLAVILEEQRAGRPLPRRY